MATTAPELTRIERSVFLKAPKNRVWRAIISPREFSTWFGAKFEGVFKPGARLNMVSTHPGEHNGKPFRIEVDRIEPEDSFSWTWGPGVSDAADASTQPKTRVEFTLVEQDGGTLVTVIETGFDQFSLERRAKMFSDNSRGWDIQMASLNQYVSQAA